MTENNESKPTRNSGTGWNIPKPRLTPEQMSLLGEIGDFLDSESAVREARLQELLGAGIPQEMIDVAIARIRNQQKTT